jgi:large subunit ribosomal protein L1
MMNKSKRYREAEKGLDSEKAHSLDEALELLLAMPQTKFDQTLEISAKLGADPKQSEQVIRGSVVLPHGTGKEVKVLVFCEAEKEKEAKDSGADFIGSEETIDKILKENWTGFDCCISTPSQMRLVSKLGRFLGPRGLMPSPKTGSVTENISQAIKEAKRGKIDFRMDKLGCIHVGVGKVSFKKDALKENAKAFLDALQGSKPSSIHTDFLTKVYLSTTMSPSIKVAL